MKPYLLLVLFISLVLPAAAKDVGKHSNQTKNIKQSKFVSKTKVLKIKFKKQPSKLALKYLKNKLEKIHGVYKTNITDVLPYDLNVVFHSTLTSKKFLLTKIKKDKKLSRIVISKIEELNSNASSDVCTISDFKIYR